MKTSWWCVSADALEKSPTLCAAALRACQKPWCMWHRATLRLSRVAAGENFFTLNKDTICAERQTFSSARRRWPLPPPLWFSLAESCAGAELASPKHCQAYRWFSACRAPWCLSPQHSPFEQAHLPGWKACFPQYWVVSVLFPPSSFSLSKRGRGRIPVLTTTDGAAAVPCPHAPFCETGAWGLPVLCGFFACQASQWGVSVPVPGVTSGFCPRPMSLQRHTAALPRQAQRTVVREHRGACLCTVRSLGQSCTSPSTQHCWACILLNLCLVQVYLPTPDLSSCPVLPLPVRMLRF